MDIEEMKTLKRKSILFLIIGILTFIVSFLISFLWVFSAMAFYISYENYKEYKKMREAGNDKGNKKG